jgi:hypothetical protein
MSQDMLPFGFWDLRKITAEAAENAKLNQYLGVLRELGG